MRGLVIENNAVLRRVFKDILKTELDSMNIKEAADGAEAFRIIGNYSPEIILMNIGLPGENGPKMIRRIKDVSPNTVVIALDVHGFPEYREAAASSGADYFLDISAMIRHKVSSLLRAILLEKGYGSEASPI